MEAIDNELDLNIWYKTYIDGYLEQKLFYADILASLNVLKINGNIKNNE